MAKMFDKLFSKKSAVRHLVQLGISLALGAWSYVAISLMTGSWVWFSPEQSDVTDPGKLTGNIAGILLMLVLVGVAGILTYWNAKKWMLPYLKKSGQYFLGAFPFLNKLVPEDKVNSWGDKIDELNAPGDTITTYYDEKGKLYSDDGRMPKIFAIPLGILIALGKGLGLSLVNLIAAIGIPLFSPLMVVLSLIVTQLLVNWSHTAALIVSITLMVAALAVFAVQPAIAFARKATGKAKEKSEE